MINSTSSIPLPLRTELQGKAHQAAQAVAGFGKISTDLVGEIDAAAARMLAAAAVEHVREGAAAQRFDAPALRAPDLTQAYAAVGKSPDRMTAEAMLMLLMGQLQQVLADTSLNSLKSRLEAFVQQMQLRRESGERLSAAMQDARAQASTALSNAELAANDAALATAAAEEANAEVERLQKELAAIEESAPEHAEKAAQLLLAQDRASTLAAAAQQALGRLDAANGDIIAAEQEVSRILAEMDEIGRGSALDPKAADAQKNRTHTARLGELLAILNQVVARSVQLKLESDIEFAIQTLKAREAENLRRSQEYQDQVQQAQDAQQKMGCIGKIVGWLIVAVSVVAAPFTGGASMALAAVGLALAIAEEVSGVSLLGKVFEPLMQVIQKVIEAVTRAVVATLQAMGVENAETIGQTIGAVLGAALVLAMMVAAFVAGKGAAAKLASKFGDVLVRNLSKVLPDVLKNAGSRISTRASLATSETAAKRVGHVMTASHVAGAFNQVGQGAGNVVVAKMQVQAAELLAAIELSLFESNVVRDSIRRSHDAVARLHETMVGLLQRLSDVHSSEVATAKAIIGKMRMA